MVLVVCFINRDKITRDKWFFFVYFYRPVYWLPIPLLLLLFPWPTRMSPCSTTSLPCTHPLQPQWQEWLSRAFRCSLEPPRSAHRQTPSSKPSLFVPLLFKVSPEPFVWCCGFSQLRQEELWFALNWESSDLSRALSGCHTGLLHQMEVQNQVRHVQAAWSPSRSCWNRWQDLACLGCRLQLVAQPVFPPKLNTAAFHRKQEAEEPDLPENQCVCYLKSSYLVFEPQFTDLMQVFATSRLSQAVGQWP